MKIINTISGGKDSQAATLWLRNNGYNKCEHVFCDVGWEHELTYKHIEYIAGHLSIEIKTLRSKKFEGLIDLARKKGRFPSTMRRFCASELKTIPMIDYILDGVQDHILIIQGIRGGESESRSKMAAQCNYFKYYLESIETNSTRLPKLVERYNSTNNYKKRHEIESKIYKIKKRIAEGKEDPKYHTYRRREVLAYCKKYSTDVLRPIFDWSAMDVINYILDNGMIPNPLYKMGFTRVGCFPCVSCNLMDLHQISQRFPERIDEIEAAENEIGSTFFPYDKISDKYCKCPKIRDVIKYVNAKYDAGGLFDDYTPTSCMSYYGLCE